MTLLLQTIHGSYLYGTDHAHSDIDIYRVISGNAKTTQKIQGDMDITTVSLDKFLTYLNKGVPQAWEALWSPYAYINPNWKPFFKSIRPSTQIFSTYHRTISSFNHSTDPKARRSATRLLINLEQLEKYGFFLPNHNEENIQRILSTP